MTTGEQEPLWAEILRLLHDNELYVLEETDDSYEAVEVRVLKTPAFSDEDTTVEFLENETGAGANDICRSLNYLESVDLLNKMKIDGTDDIMGLSPEGFKVAHEREVQRIQTEREEQRDKRQHKVNHAIGYLTLGLVLIGGLDAAITAVATTGLLSFWSYLSLSAVVAVVAFIGSLVLDEDLLSPWMKERSGEED